MYAMVGVEQKRETQIVMHYGALLQSFFNACQRENKELFNKK